MAVFDVLITLMVACLVTSFGTFVMVMFGWSTSEFQPTYAYAIWYGALAVAFAVIAWLFCGNKSVK
jgi:multidrug transporter EmrE-like cation transporter